MWAGCKNAQHQSRASLFKKKRKKMPARTRRATTSNESIIVVMGSERDVTASALAQPSQLARPPTRYVPDRDDWQYCRDPKTRRQRLLKRMRGVVRKVLQLARMAEDDINISLVASCRDPFRHDVGYSCFASDDADPRRAIERAARRICADLERPQYERRFEYFDLERNIKRISENMHTFVDRSTLVDDSETEELWRDVLRRERSLASERETERSSVEPPPPPPPQFSQRAPWTWSDSDSDSDSDERVVCVVGRPALEPEPAPAPVPAPTRSFGVAGRSILSSDDSNKSSGSDSSDDLSRGSSSFSSLPPSPKSPATVANVPTGNDLPSGYADLFYPTLDDLGWPGTLSDGEPAPFSESEMPDIPAPAVSENATAPEHRAVPPPLANFRELERKVVEILRRTKPKPVFRF
jgi:hypothetical protein